MQPHEVYEALVLWRAYQELHKRLGGDPRTSDPRDLIGKVAGYGHDRAAAAIFDSASTTSLADADHVLRELLELASTGRRPRYGNEIRPNFLDELVADLATNASSTEGAGS